MFKQRRPNLLKYLCLFLLCFTLTVACNSNQSTQTTSTPSNNGRLIVGTTLQPRTLDPADSYEIAGLNVIYNLSDTLYTYELGTTTLKPQLATEMPKISQDGLIYTIPLRQGVTFHDGTPFNAEAMAFSLKRFIENGGKPSFLLADTIAEVKASGEYELTIKLKQPFAAFTSLLAFTGTCAVSPKAYEIGANKFNPNTFVGTGPYKLTTSGSDSISLEIFDNYWGDKPVNQGVDLQIYSGNSANLYNGFLTGAVDVAYQSLDPDQIKSLLEKTAKGENQVVEAAGTAVNYLALNRNQKPLDDPKVRGAIASIINRSLINERVLQGQAEPLYSLIPTAFDTYKPSFQEKYGEANIEKAKQLITEAGFSATNPIVVEIWYPSSSTSRSLVATTLKAYAEQELGGALQFQPNAVEGATAFSNLAKGIYPAFLANWYPDFLDADNYIQPFLECAKGSIEKGCESGGAQSQGSFYYNEKMNQLISEQRKEQNPEKRKAIFGQIQDILAEDVPYIPLWQTKEYLFAQKGLQGVKINPSQSIPFWTIKK